MQPYAGILMGLALLGACEHTPIKQGSKGDAGGAAGGRSGAGGGLAIAPIGDDGMCNGQPCPPEQQCCFSTGRCIDPSRGVSDCPALAPVPVVCAGVTCPSGEICCVLTGVCVDPSTVGTSCPNPTGSSSDQDAGNSGSRSCTSNADCRPAQFCAPLPLSSLLCLGPGTCQSRSNCGATDGTGQFCGCDGVNYPSVQAECVLGVRLISDSPCGTQVDASPMPGGSRAPVIYCGADGQCPQGQQCCSITGRCYDASVPYLCTLPPPGTTLSCVDDSQCRHAEFCWGTGCSGPGGCRYATSDACTGELNPVCGCNGKSYTNTGCAIAAGVRIAHEGACGGTDAGF